LLNIYSAILQPEKVCELWWRPNPWLADDKDVKKTKYLDHEYKDTNLIKQKFHDI